MRELFARGGVVPVTVRTSRSSALSARSRWRHKGKRGGVLNRATSAVAAAAVLATAALGSVIAGANNVTSVDGTAHAETSPGENMPLIAPKIFYVYVKQGEYLWVNMKGKWYDRVEGPDGENITMISYQGGWASGYAAKDGVYKVHYTPTIDNNNQYETLDKYWWNVQAVNSADQTQHGRVWADQLFIGQREAPVVSGKQDGMGDLTLYAVSNSGYQYKLDFVGYAGMQSSITLTSSGINKLVNNGGESYCQPTHKSYDSWYVSEDSGYDAWAPSGKVYTAPEWVFDSRPYQCGEVYKIFFETPDPSLPKNIVSDPKTLEEPQVTVSRVGDTNKYKVSIRGLDKAVTYKFKLDGSPDFDLQGSESADFTVESGSSAPKLAWRLDADQSNELHVMLNDIEELVGLRIKSLNGPTAGDSTVYWDDSTLTSCRQTDHPQADFVALEGRDSNEKRGVHGWFNDPKVRDCNGKGDSRTHGDGRIIDTWAKAGLAATWQGEVDAFVEAPALTIAKTVDKPVFTQADDKLAYTYTVTNTGNVALSNVNVAEDSFNGDKARATAITCPKAELAVGEEMACSSEYTLGEEDDYAGNEIRNTAHAEGTSPKGAPVKSDPSNAVSVGKLLAPAIGVVKSIDHEPYKAGDQLTWKIRVSNTGDTPLDRITVADTYNGHGDPNPAVSCPKTELAVGEAMDCTATTTARDEDVDDLLNHVDATGYGVGRFPKPVTASSDASLAPAPTPLVPQHMPLTGGHGHDLAVVLIAALVFATIGAGGFLAHRVYSSKKPGATESGDSGDAASADNEE